MGSADNVRTIDDVPKIMAQERQSGVRGFVIGEDHADNILPEKIASQLSGYRQEGITTFYVEHFSSSEKGLLERAFAGDKDAQIDARAIIEASFHYNGTAQAHYDLIMAAHQEGMRVVPIDLPKGEIHTYYDYMTQWPEKMTEQRLMLSDPHMAGVIHENDDGQGFFVLIGKRHTYESGLGGVEDGFELNPEGGLEALLSGSGIPARSIDTTDSAHADHVVLVPADTRPIVPVNQALNFRGRLEILSSMYESMAEECVSDDLNAGLDRAVETAQALKAGLNASAPAEKLETLAYAAYEAATDLESAYYEQARNIKGEKDRSAELNRAITIGSIANSLVARFDMREVADKNTELFATPDIWDDRNLFGGRIERQDVRGDAGAKSYPDASCPDANISGPVLPSAKVP
ncbi:MAG: hypothetical protein KDI13_09410 [Alphaproteobacteria bacterium]|nr:hypothetical protein [Alphaproteobacteria bacterium]